MDETWTTRRISLEQWDESIGVFDSRTVYHSAAWLRILSVEFGLDPHLLICEDSDGVPTLAWPGLVVSKGPLQVLGSPLPGWSTPYMGPLAASPQTLARVLSGIDVDRRLGRFSYVEFRALQECASHQSFIEMGFHKQSDFETYLLDIGSRSEEELWAQLSGKCRNTVRKARKSGVTVDFETDDTFIDEFWEMSVTVFAKSGLRPQFSRGLIRRMWDELGNTGVKVATARKDGKRIAMVLLTYDHRSMYDHASCSLPEFNRFGPNNLLHWQGILEAKRMGLRTYDFISGSGAAGKFKKSFGPQKVVTSTTWGRSRTRVEKALKESYERYLRWRRGA